MVCNVYHYVGRAFGRRILLAPETRRRVEGDNWLIRDIIEYYREYLDDLTIIPKVSSPVNAD